MILILETAGIFFGWTGLLSSSFSAMLLTVIFCLEFHNIVQFRSDFETDNIPQSVYVFIVLFIIVFLYVILILKFWVSKSLLDGTKSRQSKLVKRWYDFHIFSSILFCIVIIRIPILILILVFGKKKYFDKHLI